MREEDRARLKPYPGPTREGRAAYLQHRALIDGIKNTSESLGVGVGEVIHSLTDWLGIEQCARCKRWQVMLDRIRLTKGGVRWAEVSDKIESRKIKVTWLDAK